jgi:hypothetical protein
MSDCLHCDINELVRQHVEQGANDLGEMAESLADLVLLAPEANRANLLAHAVSALGQMVLEKSGAFGGASSATH